MSTANSSYYQGFTPFQQQLLQMYSMNFSEAELYRVKQLMVAILSERIDDGVAEMLAGKDVDSWVEQVGGEHLRTKYRHNKE